MQRADNDREFVTTSVSCTGAKNRSCLGGLLVSLGWILADPSFRIPMSMSKAWTAETMTPATVHPHRTIDASVHSRSTPFASEHYEAV